jgi:hypothetical protein
MMYFIVGLVLYMGGIAGLLWNKNDKVSAVSGLCVVLGSISFIILAGVN